MAKYRVWYGDEPEYKKVSSLAEALKYFRKHDELEEDESGIEENIEGEWDEWLDEDDQNVHEHLYMYGGKSAYLRSDDDEDDEDFDDDDVEEEDNNDEVDMEDRLMNVIGGNAKVKSTEDNSDEENTFDDDEDDFDDGEDDFDDDEEE